MTTWKSTLPDIDPASPRHHLREALGALNAALFAEGNTEGDMWMISHTAWAAAHIRAWRLQLPAAPDDHVFDTRRAADYPDSTTDRQLIRNTIRFTLDADEPHDRDYRIERLRLAEANLRTLAKRHTTPRRRRTPANAQEGTTDASKPKPAVGDQDGAKTPGAPADGPATPLASGGLHNPRTPTAIILDCRHPDDCGPLGCRYRP